MASRRFLLAQMASLAKWLPYTEYVPLYDSLVPTAIDGKSVRNRARVLSIAGNSVVLNQLVENGNFESGSRWNSSVGQISISNNILTITLTQNLNANENKSICVFGNFPVVNANKYLITYQLKTSVGGTMGFDGYFSSIATNSFSADIWNTFLSLSPATKNNKSNLYIQINPSSNLAVGDTIQIRIVQVIDLTKLNPFVASWSLLTPQVQKILSMGYIPQNSGEIVDSAVSEITCDANGSRIGSLQLPAPFQLGGVGTAKNTMQITDNGYVFTRNVRRYTFTGNETFVDFVGSRTSLIIVMNDIASPSSIDDVANLISDIGHTLSYRSMIYYDNLTEYNMCVNTQGRLYIATSKTSAQLASVLAGKTVYYELATPQVITIPRKHLAVVDLGSLNWIYNSTYNIFTSTLSAAKPSATSTSLANIYCFLYLTNGFNTIRDSAGNMQVGINTASTVGIRNTNFTNAADFKTAMSGVYLFYETQDEVPDFDDRLTVDAGGTLNADSDVLANVAFEFKCR